MAAVRASASLKKRDGTLELAKDAKHLSWSPSGSKPEVTLVVATITNLQQTPPEKPKVMLKVFSQPASAIEPVTYVFQFTSGNARAEADALRDTLSQAMHAAKTSGEDGAAVTIKAAKSGGDGEWYDDERLRNDIELQQSLLKANSQLSRTFMESLRTKPDSIPDGQFVAQFWATRLGLLRSHAIDRNQSKGSYNVLSTIKTRTEDNVAKLNVTREQINLIFKQHPLVKRIYDENVPKLSEETFWSRFFTSRLLKKLKGERITEDDSKDAILDKYLAEEEDPTRSQRVDAAQIPHVIDIAGNEEHVSQKKGNAPDLWMRPTAVDRVPIIRTLNSLSEKILAQVAPNDVNPSEPIGMDEETFNALALKDLQAEQADNRVTLNINDQGLYAEKERSSESVFSRDPQKVRKRLKDVATLQSIDLEKATAVDSSDSEDESHFGSKKAFSKASDKIFDAVRQQRKQKDGSGQSDRGDLPATIFDRVTLTHATTTEFLSHFWAAFLSGDPSRADEIRKLVETLDRSMDRIQAVSKEAEAERTKEVEREKKRVNDYYERTRKRLRFDPSTIKGGSKAVNALLGPTVDAISNATKTYAEALAQAEALSA